MHSSTNNGVRVEPARADARGVLVRGMVVGWMALFLGCSGRPSAVKPPKMDVEEVAVAAVAQYDTDNSGTIDSAELRSAPSLSFAADRIDLNRDGSIEALELQGFAEKQWEEAGYGIIRVKCFVSLDGKPLDGATVTLEPEDFMQGTIHFASGVTRGGTANMDVSDENRPHPNARGAQHGLYLVRISKMVDGEETIPARYNAETELGCEVAFRASYMPGPIRFELKSR